MDEMEIQDRRRRNNEDLKDNTFRIGLLNFTWQSNCTGPETLEKKFKGIMKGDNEKEFLSGIST